MSCLARSIDEEVDVILEIGRVRYDACLRIILIGPGEARKMLGATRALQGLIWQSLSDRY
jgi:hypothetical protein